MEQKTAHAVIDPMDVKRNVTCSLPIGVWLWLKDEARRRNTNASALIVEWVATQQDEQAA